MSRKQHFFPGEQGAIGCAPAVFLTLLFLVLKLTGAIHLHWAWVLVPIFAPITVVLIIGLLASLLKAVRGFRQ